MRKEQQEIDIKKIIYSHADILSIKDEIVISNKFSLLARGITKLDEIVLDIIEYYEKEKKQSRAV